MKLGVFAVRDLAAESFSQPFYVPSRGVAIRGFSDGVCRNEPNNAWYAHPEHFVLYQLGVFDTETGLYSTGVPEQVALATDYRPAAGTSVQ